MHTKQMNIYHTRNIDFVLHSPYMIHVGDLEVVYEAVMGSLGSLGDNTTLATQGLDFNNTTMTFRLENGQTSTTIVAPIINVS